MFSCDYNGWADVPEEEREAVDAFEADHTEPVVLEYVPFVIKPLLLSPYDTAERRAA